MHRVLFVCLGNICRSPLAEAALRHEATALGLGIEVDSAGTGHWHVGMPPDPRSQAIALANAIDIAGLRARQLAESDFAAFTHIFAMDHDNLAEIRASVPAGSSAEIGLLLDLVPGREGEAVADPYYGGEEDFAQTWADAEQAARHLARMLS